ncbi:MAG: DUF1656 domain-containing protein [Dongiaceae bacterium]
MIKEIDIAGVFITPFLGWALIALIVNAVLTRVLERCGIYQWIWHRNLFNACTFVIVFSGVTFVMSRG